MDFGTRLRPITFTNPAIKHDIHAGSVYSQFGVGVNLRSRHAILKNRRPHQTTFRVMSQSFFPYSV